MSDLFKSLEKKRISLPDDVIVILSGCKTFSTFDTVRQLATAAVGGDNNCFEVKYDIPGKGEVSEAIIHKVTNGISANYTEAYMRRRDPDTMAIADNLPSDKERFSDKFGYDFDVLRKETIHWLQSQELAVFFYFAGNDSIGSGGIAIAPANAGFFAMGLSMLQRIIPVKDLPVDFSIDSVIYVAPTFRHTHFNGKQIVVHKRSEGLHEIFSYNLYPGPSAKKGLYGALLTKGEKEGWITAHCSTVQVVSPYDNITTFMHEGASGGGKSEMLQNIVREPNGQVQIGENIFTGEKRLINFPLFCSFNPVTDDMALCHPTIQRNNGKLTVLDAENGWFIRVDSITDYGDDPFLEKLTIKPTEPLLFLNIKSNPDCTALIWDHTEDSPGKSCPNPRVIVPRDIVPNIVSKPVTVDIRSFGVRTPPCTKEKPTYGIVGLFHILPPALAWLWRLVSPRGHANPSIVDGGGMGSEGVGSYWPFATGKMVTHANLLLDQIIQTPRMRYTLTPNQHIGAWKVGFKPQLLMREYLTRRGNAKLRSDQYQYARCPLLGFELNYLTIEGAKIPSRFLQVHKQVEVETSGYDAGAEILYDFFKAELPKYLTPELSATGRRIIEACLAGASVEDYLAIIPMDYQYSFLTSGDNE
ncbi:MAG: DUF4914 family protein [Bacteroidota bacterium]|nr:DUF4914 family protein [Bacteroidota bacterium]MDP3912427.1 DUF4914 family protein [Bacteroidota bacterium]